MSGRLMHTENTNENVVNGTSWLKSSQHSQRCTPWTSGAEQRRAGPESHILFCNLIQKIDFHSVNQLKEQAHNTINNRKYNKNKGNTITFPYS